VLADTALGHVLLLETIQMSTNRKMHTHTDGVQAFTKKNLETLYSPCLIKIYDATNHNTYPDFEIVRMWKKEVCLELMKYIIVSR
jgi:hypothetical protein